MKPVQIHSLSRKKLLIWGICLIFPSLLPAGEEDRRNPLGGLYLSPLQVISQEELGILDSETRIPIDRDSGIALRPKPAVDGPVVPDLNATPEGGEEETGPKSLETKIREGEGLLKRYYSQFIEEKRIWDDREKGNVYNSRTEMNDIRLLLWEKTHKNSETYIVRDSPLLYSLHIKLARWNVEIGKYSIALRHYLAAFRYHPLDMTEDFYTKGVWLEEDILGHNKEEALAHLEAKNRLLETEKNIKQKKDALHLLQSRWAKEGKSPNQIQIDSTFLFREIQELEDTQKERMKVYESSYNDRYMKYLDKRKKDESRELYAFANVVKKLEDDNKERLKIVNKLGTAGKGIYILFDYKRNTDFFAYELLLERAYRIWNENPEVLNDIAEQYRLDGKKEKAIDFYEKSLAEFEKEKSPTEEQKEKIKKSYLRLATLNADIKRVIIAGEYYEKYFVTAPLDSEKIKISYEIGAFFSEKIGSPSKAKPFLEFYLQNTSVDWNPSLTEESNLPELESLAFYYLSKEAKTERKIEKERNLLTLALNQWKKIESSLLRKETELRDLKAKRQALKKDLLVTTLDDVLSQYRLMDIKIEDEEAKIRVLETKKSKIPVTKLLFRLATLAEADRNFVQAKEYYEQVVKEGGEVEIRLAIRELERVKKIQATGMITSPLNESI